MVNSKIDFSRFKYLLESPYLILPIICFFAYGVLIPWLGLYVDDHTFIWTFETLKENGIFRYFTIGGNRPVWGLFFSFFVALLGNKPEVWHIFGIFWLFICGLIIYKIVSNIFPDQKKIALIPSSLFIVYPGMQLQFISLTVGHMYLIFSFFLLSLLFSIKSITQKKHYLIFSVLAIIASTINLLSFEYFIMLEFIRPFIIWFVIRNEQTKIINQLKTTFKYWFPYLALLTGIAIWRLFFFELQTIRYQISIVEQLKTSPFDTIFGLIPVIIKNIFWSTTIQAWGQIFNNLFSVNINSKFDLIYLFLSFLLSILIFIWLKIINLEIKISKKSRIFLVFTGLFGLFFAGWPFWATGLNVEPFYWNSRFTMPFMLGMSLLLCGLLSFIPKSWIQKSFFSLLLGLAISHQFLIANDFRIDWKNHNEFLWQLSWRLADLEVGTTILSNDLPLKYFSDNTISAELNWIASKGKEIDYPEYLFGYLSEFKRINLPFEKQGMSFKKSLISADFYGTTDKVIAINYRFGSCLRVLDPRLDPINPLIKIESQKAASISNTQLINLEGTVFDLKKSNYGSEPINNECYKFQKSQLLAQMEKWDEVVIISNEIDFQSNIIRRDPMLSIAFLDGFINTGNFEKALEVSQQIKNLNTDFSPVLCEYWTVLHKDYVKDNIKFIESEFNCNEKSTNK